MPAPYAPDFPADILNQVRSARFELSYLNQPSRALFAPKTTYAGPNQQYWVANIPLQQLEPAQWRALEGFLAALDLNRGLCRLFDPHRQVPRGRVCNPLASAALANDPGEPWGDDTPWGDGTLWASSYLNGMAAAEAAPQGRDTLLLAGAVAAQALAVGAGDLMEINGYLYMATHDVASDEAGLCRVNLRPRLREAVAPGDAVRFGRPSVAMRCTNADMIGLERASVTEFGSGALTFVEVLEG